jgi:hypothetical protein
VAHLLYFTFTGDLAWLVLAWLGLQCTTAQSKRWYFADGGLPLRLGLVIIVETAAQCLAIGLLYTETATEVEASAALLYGLRTGTWFTLCIGALLFVPLHAQRPLATLLYLCTVAMLSEAAGLLPRTPGAEWVSWAAEPILLSCLRPHFNFCCAVRLTTQDGDVSARVCAREDRAYARREVFAIPCAAARTLLLDIVRAAPFGVLGTRWVCRVLGSGRK